MNWESPIKTKKSVKEAPPPPTREEAEAKIKKMFKKPKCCISASQTKKVLASPHADTLICEWLERWIDDLVRSRSYPPQLRSNDFYSLLPTYFEPMTVLKILEEVRLAFSLAFPLLKPKEDDSLDYLPGILLADPAVVSFLPPRFLL